MADLLQRVAKDTEERGLVDPSEDDDRRHIRVLLKPQEVLRTIPPRVFRPRQPADVCLGPRPGGGATLLGRSLKRDEPHVDVGSKPRVLAGPSPESLELLFHARRMTAALTEVPEPCGWP